jgi:hypothetical protein
MDVLIEIKIKIFRFYFSLNDNSARIPFLYGARYQFNWGFTNIYDGTRWGFENQNQQLLPPVGKNFTIVLSCTDSQWMVFENLYL